MNKKGAERILDWINKNTKFPKYYNSHHSHSFNRRDGTNNVRIYKDNILGVIRLKHVSHNCTDESGEEYNNDCNNCIERR